METRAGIILFFPKPRNHRILRGFFVPADPILTQKISMVYTFDTNIMQNDMVLKACLCQNDYTMIEETWEETAWNT